MKKIFITGVFGSGKTFFAKKYAKDKSLPYIAFDKQYRYFSKENEAQRVLNSLSDAFVIDGIPFYEDGLSSGEKVSMEVLRSSWEDFSQYGKDNDVQVICVYCPDKKIWMKRLVSKGFAKFTGSETIWGRLKFIINRMLGRKRTPDNFWDLRREYIRFFEGKIDYLRSFKNASCYDSCSNEYTSVEEMLKRIRFNTFALEAHLLEQEYDKFYQDIEILDFKGYSESYKTWDSLKNLVDWKGKVVVDLGCFHGYFSFKIEDEGGIPTGLDKHEKVIETSRMINKVRGGRVAFQQWEDGKAIPDCDVILCLNVFHHFANKDAALSAMKCQMVIFEINEDDRPIIEKYFRDIKQYASCRKNRIILLAENSM